MGGCPSADTVREPFSEDDYDGHARAVSGSTRALQTNTSNPQHLHGAGEGRPDTPPFGHPQGSGSYGPAPSTPLLGALPPGSHPRPNLSILAPVTPDGRPRTSQHPDVLFLSGGYGGSEGGDPAANTKKYLEMERARISIPQTPTGADVELYKFFCPICFLHFREIWKTSCCLNHICVLCALSHVKQRSTDPTVATWYTLPSHEPISGVNCPTCNSDHVTFSRLTAEDKARSYQESPHTKAAFAAMEARKAGLELGVTISSLHISAAHHRPNMASMANTGTRPPTAGTAESQQPLQRSSTANDTASLRAVRNHAVHQLRYQESSRARESSNDPANQPPLQYPTPSPPPPHELHHGERSHVSLQYHDSADIESDSAPSTARNSSTSTTRRLLAEVAPASSTSSSTTTAASSSSSATMQTSTLSPIPSVTSLHDDVVLGYSAGPSSSSSPPVAFDVAITHVAASGQTSARRQNPSNLPASSVISASAASSPALQPLVSSLPIPDLIARPGSAPLRPNSNNSNLSTRRSNEPLLTGEGGDPLDPNNSSARGSNGGRVSTSAHDIAGHVLNQERRSGRSTQEGWIERKESDGDGASTPHETPASVTRVIAGQPLTSLNVDESKQSEPTAQPPDALFLPSPHAIKTNSQSYRMTILNTEFGGPIASSVSGASSPIGTPSDSNSLLLNDSSLPSSATLQPPSSSLVLRPLPPSNSTDHLFEESFSFDASINLGAAAISQESFMEQNSLAAVHPAPIPTTASSTATSS